VGKTNNKWFQEIMQWHSELLSKRKKHSIKTQHSVVM